MLHIHSDRAFRDALTSAGDDKLVVVDFSASWCGPCRALAPQLEKLASAKPDVTFIKLDDAECPKSYRSYGIEAFPSIKFLVAGREVGEVVGNDPGGVEKTTNKLFKALNKGKTKGRGGERGDTGSSSGAGSSSSGAGAGAGAMADTISIKAKVPKELANGKGSKAFVYVKLKVPPTATIATVKASLANELGDAGIAARIRCQFAGDTVDDTTTLATLGVAKGNTIHIIEA